MTHKRNYRSTIIVSLLSLLGTGGKASADFVTYHVMVTTTSLVGTSGSLEFQYNPASTPTTVASAVVSGFSVTSGIVSSTTEVIGSVTGDLVHSPMTLTANTPLNDILEDITFGTTFAFNVTLSGTPAPADRFSLTVWPGDINAVDNGAVNPVYSIQNDPSGAALTIDYTGVSSTIIHSSPQVLITAVPEPSSLILVTIAGTCLAARRLRDYRRRAA